MSTGFDTGAFFDEEAEGYDALHDRVDPALSALHLRIAAAVRLLGERPGAVLDCGMGPGRLLAELERRGWSVSGIDLSPEMVALARARIPQGADRLVQGSAESLPFPSGSFDGVVATGVFEYVENVPKAIGEVARVLRPGGVFVVSMPNTRAPAVFWRHRVMYGAVRSLKARLPVGRRVPLPRPGLVSLRALEQLLRDAGLEVERLEYMMLVPTALRRLAPSFARKAASRLQRLGSHGGAILSSQYVLAARREGASAPPGLLTPREPSA